MMAVTHRALADVGEVVWRAKTVQGPFEWGGRHSIFVDVLDEAGNRLVGVPIRWYWADGFKVKKSEAKPGESYAADEPMYAAGDAYSVTIDGVLSDTVSHMGLVANKPHVVYGIVFQRAVGEAALSPPPQPPPPTVPAKDKIQLIINGSVVWQS